MIDTLGLSLGDYQIDSDANLQVMPSDFNLQTGNLQANHPLFIDSSGRAIEGKKAFHNGEDFNLTIKPIASREPDLISSYIQFSVPKVLNGDNYAPTDSEGTKAALRAIESNLKAIGIRTNINTAKLSRLDAFRNVEADEPFESYQVILQVMQGQRMAKRDYGTTFLWQNSQQEICVYDKLAEMAARKQSIKGSTPNTIRFEHRLLNNRKIKNTLGMVTVSDLLSDLNHVDNCYRESMKKLLFKADTIPDNQPLSVMEAVKQFEFFKNQGGHWVQRALRAKGLQGLSVEDCAAMRQAIDIVETNRMTKSRLKKYLNDGIMDALNLQQAAPSKKTLGQLYTELQTKVLMN
jgi:hypothetical protein